MSNSNGQNSSVNGDSASNRDGTRPPMNGGSAPRNAPTVNAASTLTITETPTPSNGSNDVLPLTLRPRPNVTWDEDVIDNEGLGRKSSKRCCIFHKQRAFGESSTDSSEDDNDNDSDGSSSSGGPSGNSKPIAKKKIGKVSSKKVPDYQRFHA